VHDPRTILLTVTNIVLGFGVVVLVLGVITGTLCDVVARWKRRRSLNSELDRDMHDLLTAPPPKCEYHIDSMTTQEIPKSTPELLAMTTATMADIRQSPFFEEFQPKHMDKLMALGSEVRFDTGQIIFHEDDDPGLFYVILSGRVALEAIRGGQPLRLETLRAHDEFGWTAVLNRKRQLQARALEPVRVMAFEVSQVREACRSNPYFGAAFLERLFTIAVEQLQSTRLRLVKALAEPKTS